MAWSSEQVLALAPDASSAKSGRQLANASKWKSLGEDGQTAWGLLQGSGKAPYQTCIELTTPAFKCSCPSHKFPCKHGLALLLVLAEQPQAFKGKAAPDWVKEWLASRQEREEKKAKKKEVEAASEDDPAAQARREAEQAKRAAKREDRVAAGIEELELWLRDLVRQGLAAVQGKEYAFWEKPAARLMDAQAPGLRRLVMEMGAIPASGPGWQERLIDRIGRLYLLVQGHKRLATLSPETQADIRSWIGWAAEKEEVLAGPGVRDRWCVLGQRSYEDELDTKMRVQRTWLWGERSGRPALILQFSYGTQPFELAVMPGTVMDAELAFFPSAFQMRALMKPGHGETKPLEKCPGYPGATEGLAAYGVALAAQPWLDRFPLPLCGVTPVHAEGAFLLRDQAGRFVRISPASGCGWTLVSSSGGRPMDVMGEWDGESLLPLSGWSDGQFIVLHRMERVVSGSG